MQLDETGEIGSPVSVLDQFQYKCQQLKLFFILNTGISSLLVALIFSRVINFKCRHLRGKKTVISLLRFIFSYEELVMHGFL